MFFSTPTTVILIPAALLISLSSFSLLISAAKLEKNMSELVTDVCKNTTSGGDDYVNFCLKTFKSSKSYRPGDDSDPNTLASIIFRETYIFGNDTKKKIQSYIRKMTEKGKSGDKDVLTGLKYCKECYEKATSVVDSVVRDLDSDGSVCYIDIYSAQAVGNATSCRRKSKKGLPIAAYNKQYIRLTQICYSVALRMPYSC